MPYGGKAAVTIFLAVMIALALMYFFGADPAVPPS